MKSKHIAALIGIIVAALMLAGLMSGCKSPEKAIRYLEAKGALAGACAEKFPVKEMIIYKHGDTVNTERTIQGDSILVTDTILVKGDTVYLSKKGKCPDVHVNDRFVHDTVIQVRENTAMIAKLKADLANKEKQLQEVTADRDKYKAKAGRWWFWILVGSALTVGIRVAIKLIA